MKKRKMYDMALAMKGFYTLAIMALLAGCFSQRTTSIVGGDYDAAKDATNYFVMPYGEVSLPGKWEKCGYNKESSQQFFKNKDSVIVAVSFTRYDKYEFNKDGVLKGNDFVKAFYEWDSKYFESNGFSRQILETDLTKQSIIYRIYGEKVNTYFLIKEKNGYVSNYSINYTDKWSESEKIQFLKSLI